MGWVMKLVKIAATTIRRRIKRFLIVFTSIIIISILIPIIATSWFFGTWVKKLDPILGDAWYLRISVGEPTEFTRAIEKVLPFWRYPIFAVEFENPFAPKVYYTYENLFTTAILALVSSILVCLYSELISIRGYRVKRSIGLAGLSIPALLQSGAVAYAGIIGCSTCYGSLLVQITVAGLSITISSTTAAYAGYIGTIIGVSIGIFLIYITLKKLEKMSKFNMRLRYKDE